MKPAMPDCFDARKAFGSGACGGIDGLVENAVFNNVGGKLHDEISVEA